MPRDETGCPVRDLPVAYWENWAHIEERKPTQKVISRCVLEKPCGNPGRPQARHPGPVAFSSPFWGFGLGLGKISRHLAELKIHKETGMFRCLPRGFPLLILSRNAQKPWRAGATLARRQPRKRKPRERCAGSKECSGCFCKVAWQGTTVRGEGDHADGVKNDGLQAGPNSRRWAAHRTEIVTTALQRLYKVQIVASITPEPQTFAQPVGSTPELRSLG